MPRQNYRHMKKQKEESRKARQAEKRQRRQQMRATDPSSLPSDDAADAPAPADGPAGDAKT